MARRFGSRLASIQRYRTCERKVRHMTWEAAEIHAYELAVRTGDQVEPYECDKCAGFHVGHPRMDAEQYQAIRKRAS